MGQLVTTCPHCNAFNIAMEIFGVKSLGFDNEDYLFRGVGAIFCRRCYMPSAIHIEATGDNFKTEAGHDTALSDLVDDPHITLEETGYKVRIVLPEPANSALPSHLSPAVRKAYNAACKNARMEDCEDAAAIMFRRAIETAIKEKFPDLQGSLIKRIDALSNKGDLPEAMKDWAHEIRLIGNDGAHEIGGVTKAEVSAAHGFADSFLRYLISLPEEVRLRREKKQGKV